MRYTDPSGEFIPLLAAVAIGAFIGAATYYGGLHGQEGGWSWSGLAQATFIGAASAAVTFGIGSAASSLFTNFYSQAAFQAVAHGTFQGGMTAINGGNFWQGFAAGALSSIASSAWSGGSTTTTYKVGSFSDTITNVHGGLAGLTGLNNSVGTVLFGTIAGAGGAALTGGNVWVGAATGLTVSLLNHTFHQTDPPKGKRYFMGDKFENAQFQRDIQGGHLNPEIAYNSFMEYADMGLTFASGLLPATRLFSFATKGATSINPGVFQKFTQHAFAGGRHADLGMPVEIMSTKAYNLVSKSLGKMMNGNNTMHLSINGIQKTIMTNVENGAVRSMNMYPGISNRITQGNIITI